MSDGKEGINGNGGFFHNTNDGYAPFSVKKTDEQSFDTGKGAFYI